MKDKYNKLCKQYKNYIVFIENNNFYFTFDENAILMNFFFEYKIIHNRVVFPSKSIDKISKILKNKSINFIILPKKYKIIKKTFRKNNYNIYYDKIIRIRDILNA